MATGKAASNPARDLKDALKRPDTKHFPAIIDPKRLGELLRACDTYAAMPVVRAALKLAPMLLLRPGELRFAEWSEFDLDAAMWTVPAVRMKRELRAKLHGAPHLVPLPKQAMAALRELRTLTGSGQLVFRGERHHNRAMSENTINAALRAMGFPADEVTGHGSWPTRFATASAVHTTGPSSSSSDARCCRSGLTFLTSFGAGQTLCKWGNQSAASSRPRRRTPARASRRSRGTPPKFSGVIGAFP